MQTFCPLKVRDDYEQVPRLRLPFGTERPHQTLRWRVRQIAQFLESDRRSTGCSTLLPFSEQLLHDAPAVFSV